MFKKYLTFLISTIVFMSAFTVTVFAFEMYSVDILPSVERIPENNGIATGSVSDVEEYLKSNAEKITMNFTDGSSGIFIASLSNDSNVKNNNDIQLWYKGRYGFFNNDYSTPNVEEEKWYDITKFSNPLYLYFDMDEPIEIYVVGKPNANPYTMKLTLFLQGVWSSINTTSEIDIGYTIIFKELLDENGEDTVITYQAGKVVGDLQEPTKVGYTFLKWVNIDDSSEEIDENTILTKNITVIPIWQSNAPDDVQITFQGLNTVIKIAKDTSMGTDFPTTQPTKTGHTFVKWVIKGSTETINKDTKITQDIIVEPIWERNKLIITFNLNGGTGVVPASQTVLYNETLTLPANPTRAGYDFIGWFTHVSGGTKWGNNTPFTANTTLYAQWTIRSSGSGDSNSQNNNTTSGRDGTVAQSGQGSSSSSGGTTTIGNNATPHSLVVNVPQTPTYSDVSSNHWAYNAIMSLSEEGILEGMGDGTFGVDSLLTRAQFATIIQRAFKFSIDKKGDDFSDVKAEAWYAEAVDILSALEIMIGYDDGTFKGELTITREQMATVLFRVLNQKGIEIKAVRTDTPKDIDATSDYAKEAVIVLYQAEIINGVGNGFFAPINVATRGQAAQLIYNILDIK